MNPAYFKKFIFICISYLIFSKNIEAKTLYTIVGGGASPLNTHISLEENINSFFKLVSKKIALNDISIFFASGNNEFSVVKANYKPSNTWLEIAKIFEQEDSLRTTWKKTSLPFEFNETSKENIKSSVEKGLSADRSIFYFTGHGYRDEKQLTISLGIWNQVKLSPSDIISFYENAPKNHVGTIIFTQCYSGGFANIMYENDNKKNELSEQTRCGFFASPKEYVSSGCTSEANRANPDDYSAWFMKAFLYADQSVTIDNNSNNNKTAEQNYINPDLDDNKVISFNEAEAYVKIYDGSLDIPVKTSDVFLDDTKGKQTDFQNLYKSISFSELLKKANNIDKTVLSILAEKLSLKDKEDAVQIAEKEVKNLLLKQKKLQDDKKEQQKKISEIKKTIKNQLINNWPWLGNAYHPEYSKTIELFENAIFEKIKLLKETSNLTNLEIDFKKNNQTLEDIKKTWAKWERFSRLSKRIIQEDLFLKSNNNKSKNKYERLIECENSSLY